MCIRDSYSVIPCVQVCSLSLKNVTVMVPSQTLSWLGDGINLMPVLGCMRNRLTVWLNPLYNLQYPLWFSRIPYMSILHCYVCLIYFGLLIPKCSQQNFLSVLNAIAIIFCLNFSAFLVNDWCIYCLDCSIIINATNDSFSTAGTTVWVFPCSSWW